MLAYRGLCAYPLHLKIGTKVPLRPIIAMGILVSL